MGTNLHYRTVTPYLRTVLHELMNLELFLPFRLVSGTALSLQTGHRMSDDIDLFTDAEYGSIDFEKIDAFLRSNFPYMQTNKVTPVGFGKMYRLGDNKDSSVKLDLFYTTENFFRPFVEVDGVRLASIEEIIAMKVDILPRGPRKKDFWDLHAFTDRYSCEQMIALHRERYPYTHEEEYIRKGFVDFRKADDEPDPVCLFEKYWELIKLDMVDFSSQQ